MDVQTTLLPLRRVGSCPSPTFRSYVASVGGGDGVRSRIGRGPFGRLFGGGRLLLIGVRSCIKQSARMGERRLPFFLADECSTGRRIQVDAGLSYFRAEFRF